MKRSFVILTLGTLGALSSMTTGCVVAVNTTNSTSAATESSLMQADRDFAVAAHSRGIDGWMSFYASDAIQIRYRGNMVRGIDEIRKFLLPNFSDTTTILNWEPTDAHVFRGGSIGSTTGKYSIVSRKTPVVLTLSLTFGSSQRAPKKNPVPFWGTGLATGGPPVLQARPVAPFLQWERQFRSLYS